MLKIVWLLIAIIITTSLVRTLWLSRQSRALLDEKQQAVEQLEQETTRLETEVKEATSSFSLERRVRDELRLHQDGESIIRIKP